MYSTYSYNFWLHNLHLVGRATNATPPNLKASLWWIYDIRALPQLFVNSIYVHVHKVKFFLPNLLPPWQRLEGRLFCSLDIQSYRSKSKVSINLDWSLSKELEYWLAIGIYAVCILVTGSTYKSQIYVIYISIHTPHGRCYYDKVVVYYEWGLLPW